jgi:CubicO group peptidase (beta-lactamase class C family)
MHKSFHVILLLTLCCHWAQAQLPDSLAKKVDLIFSKWDKTNSPGCSIALVKDGKIMYSRGYGMSNLEYNLAITPASGFHVASLSKQFTAAAIQHLALEGKLSLTDDIRKYIPELPDFGQPITIGELMHHTSGLRDQWDLLGLSGWREDDVKTENDILELLKRQKALNFQPGAQYIYCNSGFTLLGIAVKRITGVSLRHYDDSVFFKPLEMYNTVFHSDHSEIIPNRTSAYDMDDSGRWEISIPVFDNYGATSLFTTAEDLAKWDENFYSKKIGGPAFIRAMLTTGILNDGTKQNYASGLTIGQYKGNNTVEHNGADAGYRADILRFPDLHFSVIILANLAGINPSNLGRKVADMFIPDKTPADPASVPVDSLTIKKLAGYYLDPESNAIGKLEVQHGKLLSNGTILRAESDSIFVNSNSGSSIHIRMPGGRTTFVIRSPDMRDRIYEKVDTVAASAVRLSDYVGAFYSSELEVKYVVSIKDSALSVKIPRNDPFKLEPFIREYFTGFSTLHFLRNKKGQVTGFLLSTGRSWNMYFARVSPLSPL